MPNDDRPITVDDVYWIFEAHDREMFATIFEMMGAPEAAAAVRKQSAQQGDDELRRVDPVTADQRDAVRAAMEQGAHLTTGIDAGFRHGPGLYKIAAPTDDGGGPGPAERAIRRQ